MKKDKQKAKDELRNEYKLSDFPKGLVRGKFTKRIQDSSNIIVLTPEVAEVFPNEKAVNSALLSLINIAHKTAKMPKHPVKKIKKRLI